MSNSRHNGVKQEVSRVMRAVQIPKVSSAVLGVDGAISTMSLTLADDGNNVKEGPESIFGMASLSKTVFAYLVLKLIDENKKNADDIISSFNLPNGIDQFDLDTPLYKVLPELDQGSERAHAKKLTARMVLSHQTGILCSHESGPPKFAFEPGKGYEYNGLPYIYLQIAVERMTGASLEKLAQLHVFGPAGMSNSSFLRPDYTLADAQRSSASATDLFSINLKNYPAISANSMTSTASDYMRFVAHWLNDDRLSTNAFESQISMSKDQWAIDMGVSKSDLDHLASGLGWALQKNDDGIVVRAFHWADMDQWRADVAIDLENKTAVVFLTNSSKGHILADHIISPHVELDSGLRFITDKLGFAVRFEKNWDKKENARMSQIGYYLKDRAQTDVGMHAMARSSFGQGSNIAKGKGKAALDKQINTDSSPDTAYKSPTPFSKKFKPSGAKD